VGIDAFKELDGIGPLHIDFAERRCVHNADGVTRRQALPADARNQVFAGLRVVPGAQPLANDFERRSARFVPRMQCRLSNRVVQATDICARTNAKCHRRIGWPECRRADTRNRFSKTLGQHGHAVDIAKLALIGAETQCGVVA